VSGDTLPIELLLADAFGSHVYMLARCGHCAEAPDPDPALSEAELLPSFVDCPQCHTRRRVIGYVPIEAVL
jgi:hypothetical protein